MNVTATGKQHGDDLGGGWTLYKGNYNSLTLKPGDFIRINNSQVYHSAIVWKIENNLVYVAECLGSKGCEIHWGTFNNGYPQQYTVERIKSEATYIISAPELTTTCMVSYQLNGGSGTATSQTVTAGETVQLHGAPTKSGAEFCGWKCGSTIYNAGQSITVNANMTLTAVWKYRISFQTPSGFSTPASRLINPGESVGTLPVLGDTATNAFGGWKYGNTTVTASFVPTCSLTLTMIAIPKVEVKFYSNPPVTNVEEQLRTRRFKVGSPYGSELPDPFEQDGYRFAGWFTARTDGTEHTAETVVSQSVVTLYAHWEILHFAVSFDNSTLPRAQWSPVIRSAFKDRFTFPPIRHSIPYHICLYWKEKYSIISGNAGEEGIMFANQTYKPYARRVVSRIIFNANGGTGTFEQLLKIGDDPVYLPAEVPVREGYQFLGWALEENAQAPQFARCGEYRLNRDSMLYAVWKANTDTRTHIYYNLTAGEYKAPVSEFVQPGEQYQVSTTIPFRSGKIFLYWQYTVGEDLECAMPGSTITVPNSTSVRLSPVWDDVESRHLDLHHTPVSNFYTLHYIPNEGPFGVMEEPHSFFDPSKIFSHWAYLDSEGNDVPVNRHTVKDFGMYLHLYPRFLDRPTLCFTDMTSQNWYYDAVEFVTARGGLAVPFRESETVSRRLLVQTLYRKEGSWEIGGNSFTDAGDMPEVSFALHAGLTSVGSNGRFEPDGNLTREQLATFLYRYATYRKYDTTLTGEEHSFTDVAADRWSRPMIAWAADRGIMCGTTETTFEPEKLVTKGVLALVMKRFAQEYEV